MLQVLDWFTLGHVWVSPFAFRINIPLKDSGLFLLEQIILQYLLHVSLTLFTSGIKMSPITSGQPRCFTFPHGFNMHWTRSGTVSAVSNKKCITKDFKSSNHFSNASSANGSTSLQCFWETQARCLNGFARHCLYSQWTCTCWLLCWFWICM